MSGKEIPMLTDIDYRWAQPSKVGRETKQHAISFYSVDAINNSVKKFSQFHIKFTNFMSRKTRVVNKVFQLNFMKLLLTQTFHEKKERKNEANVWVQDGSKKNFV